MCRWMNRAADKVRNLLTFDLHRYAGFNSELRHILSVIQLFESTAISVLGKVWSLRQL